METTIFNADSISANQALELSHWLNSVPGVNDVSVDVTGSQITVSYDPATTDRISLKNSISSTGIVLH